MIWLILSILCSTLIFVVFKLFDSYRVNNLQAIITNYFVAFTVGFLTGDIDFQPLSIVSKAWFPSSLILGFVFITLFHVMAAVSQKFGVSIVSVAVKMSLAIPVIAAVILYDERLHFLKILGIVAALAAVYMASYKSGKQGGRSLSLWLPIILFLGSGLLDAFINYNQKFLVESADHAYFASASFLNAGIFGLIFILIKRLSTTVNFEWKNILGGIALGIPNYGSIYFLLRALDVRSLESSVIFPINNVGIVALSVIIGKLVFRERLTPMNKIGVFLAILAIIIITF